MYYLCTGWFEFYVGFKRKNNSVTRHFSRLFIGEKFEWTIESAHVIISFRDFFRRKVRALPVLGAIVLGDARRRRRGRVGSGPVGPFVRREFRTERTTSDHVLRVVHRTRRRKVLKKIAYLRPTWYTIALSLYVATRDFIGYLFIVCYCDVALIFVLHGSFEILATLLFRFVLDYTLRHNIDIIYLIIDRVILSSLYSVQTHVDLLSDYTLI